MLGSKFKNKSHLLPKFQALQEWSGLTEDQKKFFSTFFTGQNILLTGSGGVGKSFCINLLQDFLSKEKIAVARTASTGVAAFNIGGQTIHSWAGVGLAQEDVQYLIDKIKKNRKAQDRIRNTNILVIDEISMIKGELLDKLDVIFKYFRKSNEPFGGLTILATGDFLQLAPVWKKDETREYAFESRSWEEAKFQKVELKQVVRQSDKEFIQFLHDLRMGKVKDLSILKNCINRPIPEDKKILHLYCKNVDVDRINKEKLDEIKGQSKIFKSRDSGQDFHIEAFNKNCPAPQVLELKVGAQVMNLSNADVKNGVVNGALGVVKAFTSEGVKVQFKHTTAIISEHSWEIKEQEVGLDGVMKYKTVATRRQIPLKVAFASSIHKSQGQTLDEVYIDLNEAFGEGMHYVALSRVKGLDGLYLADFDIDRLKVDRKCVEFYEN